MPSSPILFFDVSAFSSKTPVLPASLLGLHLYTSAHWRFPAVLLQLSMGVKCVITDSLAPESNSDRVFLWATLLVVFVIGPVPTALNQCPPDPSSH